MVYNYKYIITITLQSNHSNYYNTTCLLWQTTYIQGHDAKVGVKP